MYQINDCVFLCLPASIKDLDPERKDRIRIRPCLNSWELNKTAKPTKSISKTRKQCRFCLPGWICTFFSDFWSQSSIFLTIWPFWNSWRYYTFYAEFLVNCVAACGPAWYLVGQDELPLPDVLLLGLSQAEKRTIWIIGWIAQGLFEENDEFILFFKST